MTFQANEDGAKMNDTEKDNGKEHGKSVETVRVSFFEGKRVRWFGAPGVLDQAPLTCREPGPDTLALDG